MKTQKKLSACCQAPVTIEHGCDSDAGHLGACTCSGDEITMFYVCSKCNNACDIYVNLDLKKMKKESDKDKKAYHDNPKAFPKLELTPEQVATSKSVPDWEGKLINLVCTNQPTLAVEFIRNLLSKQETEYKKKIGCRHNKTRYECPCFHEGFETADAEQGFNKIQKLKQQHKEELEKIKAEHEKELESLVKENADIGERFLILSLTSSKRLKQLKQQHWAELEGLKMKGFSYHEPIDEKPSKLEQAWSDGYNKARKKINTEIDKLLNSKKRK